MTLLESLLPCLGFETCRTQHNNKTNSIMMCTDIVPELPGTAVMEFAALIPGAAAET